ncbi:MAG TPA: molybdate ABC transporter substrate-binding protein [Thermomicrobiales bacterium]|nr:molybdate ABC transporter substrate-binding protein [Thermomicrobiales bacterium]
MRSRRQLRLTSFLVSILVLVLGIPIVTFPVAAQATPIDCTAYSTPIAAGSPIATPDSAPPTNATPVAFPAGGGKLMVFAAASLTESFNAMKDRLEATNPGLEITYNFAGSQALVTQLTEGSPADVFASANGSQMQAAQEAGVLAGAPVDFAQNSLAVIVPKENPAGIATYADLGKPGIKLVVAQADVPVGNFARQSVCKAALDTTTYGDDFVAGVRANIVSEEDNVKAVASKVALGEADAGIVYITDITSEIVDQVQVIEIQASVNVVATYPIAPVRDGNAELAAAFIAYVTGPEGQAILQESGFQPVR